MRKKAVPILISLMFVAASGAVVFDDFEDGDMDEWVGGSTSTDSYEGTYSGHWNYGSTDYKYRTVQSGNKDFTEIKVWFMSDPSSSRNDESSSYCHIRPLQLHNDGQNIVNTRFEDGCSDTQTVNGNTVSNNDYTNGNWYPLRLKLDYANDEIDAVYIDGVKQASNIAFNNPANEIDKIGINMYYNGINIDYLTISGFNDAPEFNSTSIAPANPSIGDTVNYSAEVYDAGGNIQHTNLSLTYGGTTVLSNEKRSGTTPEWNNTYTINSGGKWLNASLTTLDDKGATNTTEINKYISNSPPSITVQGPADTNINPSNANPEVDVSDADGEEMNITFYNASDDTQIGKVENVEDGTYSVAWNSLSEDQTYNWYSEATDGVSTVTSSTASFTTIGINLNWNDESSNEDGFRIYSNASGTLQEVASTGMNTETSTVYNSGLEFGKNTTYEIAAYNQYGESNRITGYVTP